MNFDRIIMNPPYCRNLHLKILEQAISLLKDDGNCINLSPIRWLQDPLAKYKKNSDYCKFEESVAKHIKSLSEIKAEDATGMFNVLFPQDLGVYVMSQKGGFDYITYNNGWAERLIKVIRNHPTHWSDVSEENMIDGVRVKCQKVRNSGPSSNTKNLKSYTKPRDAYDLMYRSYSCVFIDGCQGDKWWTEFGNKNKYTKSIGTPLVDSIKFDNVESAKRFEQSCNTAFMKFCNYISKVGLNTDFSFLPWMGDCINPRTGLKGYESEWTNKDFYEYFGITEQEQKEIEETMKPYM